MGFFRYAKYNQDYEQARTYLTHLQTTNRKFQQLMEETLSNAREMDAKTGRNKLIHLDFYRWGSQQAFLFLTSFPFCSFCTRFRGLGLYNSSHLFWWRCIVRVCVRVVVFQLLDNSHPAAAALRNAYWGLAQANAPPARRL